LASPLTIGNPSPAPSMALRVAWLPRVKAPIAASISLAGMPGPLSLTDIDSAPDGCTATAISRVPPGGVNLMALDSRLSQIWRTERSPPRIIGSSTGKLCLSCWPRCSMRSAVSLAQSRPMRPTCTGFVLDLQPSRLDARQIEDVVDEAQQIVPEWWMSWE
jgi:hypothetical protein